MIGAAPLASDRHTSAFQFRESFDRFLGPGKNPNGFGKQAAKGLQPFLVFTRRAAALHHCERYYALLEQSKIFHGSRRRHNFEDNPVACQHLTNCSANAK